MQHSTLYLFNPKDFVKIRNRSTQTKINIFIDICNLKKKQKNNNFTSYGYTAKNPKININATFNSILI